jgi:hypothetical protein
MLWSRYDVVLAGSLNMILIWPRLLRRPVFSLRATKLLETTTSNMPNSPTYAELWLTRAVHEDGFRFKEGRRLQRR